MADISLPLTNVKAYSTDQRFSTWGIEMNGRKSYKHCFSFNESTK